MPIRRSRSRFAVASTGSPDRGGGRSGPVFRRRPPASVRPFFRAERSRSQTQAGRGGADALQTDRRSPRRQHRRGVESGRGLVVTIRLPVRPSASASGATGGAARCYDSRQGDGR
jgi:hypothetical protein